MALMEQGKVTCGENMLEAKISPFFLLPYLAKQVCALSSDVHFDVGSCPPYPYRRLTEGGKDFPDPAKADEKTTLNKIISEIHSHIETCHYRVLTKV